MLVIIRREGEEVVIGNPASPIGIVRVASIKGDRVGIAFEFPREIAVHPKEVAEQILAGAVDPTKNAERAAIAAEVARTSPRSADAAHAAAEAAAYAANAAKRAAAAEAGK